MKNKKLLYIAIAVIITIALALPCFAADGQSYHIIISDETIGPTYSTPIEINLIEDNNYLYADYDNTNRQITLYVSDSFNVAPYSTGTTMLYTIQLPQYYYATIELTRGNHSEVNQIGYDIITTRMIFDMTNDISIENTWIDVQIGSDYSYGAGITQGHLDVQNNPNDYGLYSQAQYNQYGIQRYNAGYSGGIYTVESNPNLYDLYTEQQYLNYGTQNYNSGYAAGQQSGGGASQEQIEAAYNEGKQAGQRESRQLVGIINVIVSGIATAFTNFYNQAGILGVSLSAIAITGIIILLVYLIFKAVKS